jgi:glycosyltransferase involved in cell wall biosynthesis
MDGDLQHPPSVVPLLVDEWRRGARIVHTVRVDSDDLSWFKRTASRAYYRLFTFLSGVPITPGMADFRLLDRQVVDELLQFREVDVFLRGLVEWVGYPSATVAFQAARRHSGDPKYTFRRMLKFAWTGITSFSLVPLRAGIVIGLVTAVLSFAALVHAVWVRLVTPQDAVPGWATIVALIGLFFGILFVLIGVLGEYLARILVQVRQRPRFLVSGTVGFGSASGPSSTALGRVSSSAQPHAFEGQHATPPARPAAGA